MTAEVLQIARYVKLTVCHAAQKLGNKLGHDARSGGLAIAFSAYLRSFTFRLLLFNPRFPCGYYRADEWRFCIASKALFLMPYMEPRTIKNFSKFVCHGAVPFVSRVRNKRYRNSASLNLFQDRAEGYGLWHKHRQLKRFAPLHWKNIS